MITQELISALDERDLDIVRAIAQHPSGVLNLALSQQTGLARGYLHARTNKLIGLNIVSRSIKPGTERKPRPTYVYRLATDVALKDLDEAAKQFPVRSVKTRGKKRKSSSEDELNRYQSKVEKLRARQTASGMSDRDEPMASIFKMIDDLSQIKSPFIEIEQQIQEMQRSLNRLESSPSHAYWVLLEKALGKLPDFDSAQWSEAVQMKWFELFAGLLEVIKNRSDRP